MEQWKLALVLLHVLAYNAADTVAFLETNKVARSLNGLANLDDSFLSCYRTVMSPLNRVRMFVADTMDINTNLAILYRRCDTLVDIIGVTMAIPLSVIRNVISRILIPIRRGLQTLQTATKVVQVGIGPFVTVIESWSHPIGQVVKQMGDSLSVLKELKSAVEKAKQNISNTTVSLERIPCGDARSRHMDALESSARGHDALPTSVSRDLSPGEASCQNIQEFFGSTNSKISAVVSRVLTGAKDSLDMVLMTFDPISDFLDGLDKILDTQICLQDVLDGITKLADKFVSVIDDGVKQVKVAVKDVLDEVSDVATDTVKEIKTFFSSWGRKRRSSSAYRIFRVGHQNFIAIEPGSKYMSRVTRDAKFCFSVRDILNGIQAINDGYLKVAQFLVQQLIKRIFPESETHEMAMSYGFGNFVTNLAKTLLPFESDFDLNKAASRLIIPRENIDKFLLLDYEKVFDGLAIDDKSLTENSQTCQGEVELNLKSAPLRSEFPVTRASSCATGTSGLKLQLLAVSAVAVLLYVLL